jgi:ribosome biogenesis protein ENP2
MLLGLDASRVGSYFVPALGSNFPPSTLDNTLIVSTRRPSAGSGLMLLGLDASRVGSYFVPALGPAPRWASFLEGLTEELEESTPSLYDDYR